MSRLQSITDAALSHLSLDELLEQLLTRLTVALKADVARILLVSDDGQDMVLRASQPPGPVGLRIRAERTMVRRILTTDGPVNLGEVRGADWADPNLRAVRSLIGMRLVVGDRVIGLVHVGKVRRHFEAADLQVLQLVADRLALAIDHARIYEAEQQARQTAERGRLAAEEARRQLAQVIEALPVPVLIADLSSRTYSSCNRAFKAALGIDVTGQEMRASGEHFLKPRRPDGTPVGNADMPTQLALFAGQTVEGMELVLSHPGEDRDVWIRANSVPLRSSDGTIYGAVTAFQDITSVRELERQKDAFLAAVSHDLKSPLTLVNLRVDLLLREASKLPGAAEHFVQGIEETRRAVARMIRQVEELVELTRMQLGHELELQREAVDLVGLLQEAVHDEQQVRGSRIRIERPDFPVQGQWDRTRLRRAFANLLNNAVKYSPRDAEVLVRISLEPEPAGPWAVVSVEDRGIGVPATELPRLFQPFFRASNAGRAAGSGIGLSGVRQIITAHGGTVTAESEEGVGSTFTVRLPLVPPPP